MPWARNSDLPASVKGVLPEAALSVFRAAANPVFERGGSDEEAMTAGWAAVKAAGYSKGEDDKWVKLAFRLPDSAVVLSAYQVDATNPEKPVDICRVGKWKHRRYGPLDFNDAVLQNILANFNKQVIGHKVPCDYEHDIFNPLIPGEQKKAAGQVETLELTADESGILHLHGKVNWTPKGRQAVSDREFQYISPVIEMNYVDKESGAELGPTLVAIALTNVPYLTRLSPIAASEAANILPGIRVKLSTGGNIMDKLIEGLKAAKLDFATLSGKVKDAGVKSHREVAAFLSLLVDGKLGMDTAEATLPPEVVAALDPAWAAELKTANVPEVKIAPPSADDLATMTKAFAFSEVHNEPSTIKVVRFSERSPMPDKRIADLMRDNMKGKVAQLRTPNPAGFALPPSVCDKAEALLVALSTGDVPENGRIQLSEKVTVESPAEGFLHLLSEIRNGGMVKVGTDVKEKSDLPFAQAGTFDGLLKFNCAEVPQATLEGHAARLGVKLSELSVESVVLNELTEAVMGRDKVNRQTAMATANRLIAAAKEVA
jgi:cation transport regulator ChaB